MHKLCDDCFGFSASSDRIDNIQGARYVFILFIYIMFLQCKALNVLNRIHNI